MQLRKAVLAAVLVASLALASGADLTLPSWYKCDPTTCTAAKNCVCPSTSAPGGLKPEEIPQFILFTHDDAVDENANKVVRGVSDGLKNPNGCPVPVTWFVTKYGTDCSLIRGLYADHHEIATHTITHPNLNSLSDSAASDEILGARKWLNETCRIPLSDLIGFRSPFLVNRPAVRKTLSDAGYLYDSTLNEHFPSDTSPDSGSRLWPYTLNGGVAQDCTWIGPPDTVCDESESYPGLWEVPMWDQQANPTNDEGAYTMDYEGDVNAFLQKNFAWTYGGNRAPFPIYIHAPWLTPEHIAATKKFIQWALAKEDVYLVTMRQLTEWMRNPVPKSEIAKFLTCDRPGATTAFSLPGGMVPTVPATVAAPSPAVKVPVAAAPAPAPTTAKPTTTTTKPTTTATASSTTAASTTASTTTTTSTGSTATTAATSSGSGTGSATANTGAGRGVALGVTASSLNSGGGGRGGPILGSTGGRGSGVAPPLGGRGSGPTGGSFGPVVGPYGPGGSSSGGLMLMGGRGGPGGSYPLTGYGAPPGGSFPRTSMLGGPAGYGAPPPLGSAYSLPPAWGSSGGFGGGMSGAGGMARGSLMLLGNPGGLLPVRRF